MKKGWEIKKLGDLGKVSMCKRIMKNQTTPTGDIPFYKIGTFGKTPNAFIADEVYEEYKSKYSFPKKGDILLSASGTIGRRVVYDGNPAYFQDSNIVWIDNNEEIVLNEYLFQFYGFCNWNPSKGSTISRLYNDDLRRITIPFPKSLEEQKKIVAILDKTFEKIEIAKKNVEKNLQNAKELFQSELNRIFSQKGKGWVEKQLGAVTVIITKGSSPKWQGVEYITSPGVLFVTSENVGEGKILLNKRKYVEERFNQIETKSILKKGDVLTNIVGASIGRTAVYNINDIANINQAVCAIRCRPQELYNYYLTYLLNSPYLKNILHDNEVNNARANLSLTFFRNLIVLLPPLEKQKEIVERLDSLSSDIKQLEAQYSKKLVDLEELKKSILQKAFEGELV
ncbi:MAG: restriction endonuclease subunit S [Candidatus Delongbacteria bacterium]|jgi:type I restriction enzyme S subunit|nr:restriction endonuclease subunit S [Candidatus Delongbacteria bacterium]